MMEPAIPVTPLPAALGTDWESLRRTFRGRPTFELGQNWREVPEAHFSAGQVRLGLSGMSLAVFASLRDRDVFNPVEHFNMAAFSHGDVFEIFLQPENQTAYYEFHITPGATLLQLRWPQSMRDLPLDWTGLADPLLPYKVFRWRIHARTQIVDHGWELYAEIPLKRIYEDEPPWDGSRLRVNFTRYDYTRGRLRPVLSATAPLCAPDFHDAPGWPVVELGFH